MRRCFLLLALALPIAAAAQNDEAYGKKIREYTTESFFLPDIVDHLPASRSVPSPDKFLGHIVGAPNVLTYSKQAADYLRLLEKSSRRVKVFSMGLSEEGREMVVAAISDEGNLRRLDDFKKMNAQLGDPRQIKDEKEADRLIKQSLPMYWATGGMHAPETGPPEMLMELAYRLAVSEEPMIKTIRKNEIVMLTPVLDVDGRDRVVDLYRYRKANPKKPPIPLVYWGHYVAHDDNRDALTMALNLSKSLMKTWLDFKPTVLHDLHESEPYLYISTGTGPYNAWLDPIVISEWQEMAYNEIQQMTEKGVPGVWTHNYYDGWAPSYGFYVANGHNGIGRFYETFGGSGADTGIRSAGETTKEWYRPNPPFPRVRWSIRNNVNIMQAALLMGMSKVATEKDKFMRNYYLKSKRSIAKATTEGPAAWIIDAKYGADRAVELCNIMTQQGVEVSSLGKDVTTAEGKFAKGSWIIRMDQPYSRMADMMLDTQYYNPTDPRSYDDTGWEIGPLFGVRTTRVKDVSILKAPTERYQFNPAVPSRPAGLAGKRIALVHTWSSTQDEGWARIAFDQRKIPYSYVSVHEIRDTPFLKNKYDVIIFPNTGGSAQSIVNGSPMIGDPIPYKPTQEYPNLGGPDATDDTRGGIELKGMTNLQKFVNDGGIFICIGNTCRIPIDYGIVNGVSVFQPTTLNAPGGVYEVDRVDETSPVLTGYGDSMGAYFNMNGSVILASGGGGFRGGRGGRPAGGATRSSGRGTLTDPDVIQGRPPYTPKSMPGDEPESNGPRGPRLPASRTLLRFADAGKVLMSGMIDHPEELAGKPAVVDCPVGKGHVLLFGINPFWRGETVGSYNLIFNAIRYSANLGSTDDSNGSGQ
ncbi:MAG: M14 family zinc carboxypeptidase [Fimbriimonas sp.]|nr:M14 family zinc carboxypeptidase [Fimbriimonas sp.]